MRIMKTDTMINLALIGHAVYRRTDEGTCASVCLYYKLILSA